MLHLGVFEKDMEAEHSLQVARRVVIKQRQMDREGQTNIMSKNIEAIQLRQKNEKKIKTKAEDSPKKGTPQKTPSQKPEKTPSQKPVDISVGKVGKVSSQPQVTPKALVIAVKPAPGGEVSDKTSVHEGNGTMEHRGLRPGENGTPVHRVPPPLPAGVVVEEEDVDKKKDKSKKKSQKKEMKEEKEREKQRLKEMKQKEKEEREKHKAQFKAAKKASKEKDKKSKKEEQSSKKDEDKSIKVQSEVDREETLPTQTSVPTAATATPAATTQQGENVQTFETQKKEYMHLSDPSPQTNTAEGNEHESNKLDLNVTTSETTQVSKEQEGDKESPEVIESPDVTEITDEPVFPGVKRIVVKEADSDNVTDTVEKDSKSNMEDAQESDDVHFVTEEGTLSENVSQKTPDGEPETVPEIEPQSAPQSAPESVLESMSESAPECAPESVPAIAVECASSENAPESAAETASTGDLTKDTNTSATEPAEDKTAELPSSEDAPRSPSNTPTETDIDIVQSLEGKTAVTIQPLENGVHSDTTTQEDKDDEHQIQTKTLEETDAAPTRNGFDPAEPKTVENGSEETHIDDAENVVVEDLDNEAKPKGVMPTAL